MKRFWTRFAAAAAERPEGLAVVDRNMSRETTYLSLDMYSSQIAAELFRLGIAPETLIPVKMPRSMEYIVAMLGVLKAGCGFIPIAEDYPAERVHKICEDCGASLVLGMDFVKRAMATPARDPSPRAGANAFAIYTSGSTGNPKGILWNRVGFSASLERLSGIFRYDKENIHLSTAPFNFVAFVIDVFVPLYNGSCIHILPDECRRDIRRIEDYIAQHGVNSAIISPQLLKLFYNRSDTLRLVITGTERVSCIAPDGYRVVNLYGSSETTPGVVWFEVDREYENTPIGQAAGDITVELLGEDGRSVSDGEEGEICVTGLLSTCYLNLPEKSAKAYENLTDGRVRFHMGDIGRRNTDGNLVYVNRKDWMVKVNGQRVEIGEVEAVMHQLDGVSDAVVKGFVNAKGQIWLCGYYTGQSEIPPERLKAGLRKTLPEYMIPLLFMHLEAFPLNANNKVDRKSLQPPDVTAAQRDYVPPVTAMEKRICEAFCEALECEHVGLDDDFFELGGDSLGIVILSELLEKLDIHPDDIYYGKTPRQIEALKFGLAKKPENGPVPVQKSNLAIHDGQLTSVAFQDSFALFPAVLDYAVSAASCTGLDQKTLYRLRLALEELLSWRIQTAYPDGGTITLDVTAEGTAIRLTVSDKGVPNLLTGSRYDTLDADDTTGLEEFLVTRMADRFGSKKLGAGGQQFYIAFNLPKPVSPQKREDAAPPLDTDFIFRDIQTEQDVVDALGCLYDEYGYGYGHEELYYPEKFLARVREGHLRPCLIANAHGEAAAYGALAALDRLDGIWETGSLVVKRRFRGYPLAWMVQAELLRQAERIPDCRMLYSEPVATHTLSQQMVLKAGFIPTGARFNFLPASAVNSTGDENTRFTLFTAVRPSGLYRGDVVYAPEPLCAYIRNIYEKLGCGCDLLPCARPVGKTELSMDAISGFRLAAVTVTKVGNDFREAIEETVLLARKQLLEHIDLTLFLSEPGCSEAYGILTENGFHFGGIVPGSTKGCSAIMCHPLDTKIDREAIQAVGGFSEILSTLWEINKKTETGV